MAGNFNSQVIKFVSKIPRGKVVSYGRVAAACGHPRAARQVGAVLKALNISTAEIPWWRVVNKKGEISIKGNWTADKKLQQQLLLKDGVEVEGFKIKMSIYQWKI